MKMSYVSPTGQKVTAAPADGKNIPTIDVSDPPNSQPSPTPPTSPISQTTVNLSTAEDFRKFIEVEVLKIIKKLAEEGKTPKEKIQAIAQLTLDLIKPGMNLEELYTNAVKLDDSTPELAPVVFQVMKEYEQKYEKKAIDEVSQMVRSGRYDDAEEMVKKVLNYKITN